MCVSMTAVPNKRCRLFYKRPCQLFDSVTINKMTIRIAKTTKDMTKVMTETMKKKTNKNGYLDSKLLVLLNIEEGPDCTT